MFGFSVGKWHCCWPYYGVMLGHSGSNYVPFCSRRYWAHVGADVGQWLAQCRHLPVNVPHIWQHVDSTYFTILIDLTDLTNHTNITDPTDLAFPM